MSTSAARRAEDGIDDLQAALPSRGVKLTARPPVSLLREAWWRRLRGIRLRNADGPAFGA